jgi:glutaredoxin-related protein
MNFDVSILGAARLGVEQDIELTIAGRNLNAFPTFDVKTGSKWDPENTGSVQATFDLLDEENARMAIPNWSSGTIPAHQIAVELLYGKRFAEDESDFEVVQVEWPSMPQLIKDGDLATGIAQAFLGGTTRMERNGELKPLYWPMDLLPKEGYGIPPLASMPVRREYFEENQAAVEAVMSAYEQELQWLMEDPTGIVSEDPYLEMMNTDGDADLAQYIIQWVFNDIEGQTFEEPPMSETGYLNDEYIDGVRTYLDQAVELGQVSEDWEDYVNFVQLG